MGRDRHRAEWRDVRRPIRWDHDDKGHALRQAAAVEAAGLGLTVEIEAKIDDLRKHLPRDIPVVLRIAQETMRGGPIRNAGPYALRGPGDPKQWRNLFGDDGFKWPDRETNAFSAVFSGRYHPGLVRASMTEGVPSSEEFRGHHT